MDLKQKTQKSDKATLPGAAGCSAQLRPEEAVLGHCKVSGSAGPASAVAAVPFFAGRRDHDRVNRE